MRDGPRGAEGVHRGAAFFGWLVAIAVAVLLAGIAGAIAGAVGRSANTTQSDARRQAGTIGIVAALVLLVVLLIAYCTGGYVAGRMFRFDGSRQGLAVWLIGLVVTIIAGALGATLGSQYDILDRVSLPRVPVSADQLSLAGLVTTAVIVITTLLAAIVGGKVGHRYHDKVDRAAYR